MASSLSGIVEQKIVPSGLGFSSGSSGGLREILAL